MSVKTQLPNTGGLRYATTQHIQALDLWLHNTEPSMALECIKDLFRGYLQSDLMDGKDPRQRSELYYDFERLCEFMQQLMEAEPPH